MHTRGVFLAFAEGSPAARAWKAVPIDMKAAVVSRVANLIRIVAPVFLLSRPSDLGVAGRVLDPHYGCGGIYVYDNYPGGIGLSDSIADRLEEFLAAASDVITDCPCSDGCPSCVGALDDRDDFDGNPKELTGGFLLAWKG